MKWKLADETEVGTTRHRSVFAFIPTTVVSNSDGKKYRIWFEWYREETRYVVKKGWAGEYMDWKLIQNYIQ